jgi:hypothetical protein
VSQYAREHPEAPEPFEDIAERADEMRKERRELPRPSTR